MSFRKVPSFINIFSLSQDDCFTDMQDSFLYDLFTKISHHASLSVILVLQFLFMKTKSMRVLSANSHVTTLFRSPRDQLSIRILNSHMYPRSHGFLPWAMDCATSKHPFSSLTIDSSPLSNPKTRVRNTSFPQDDFVAVYQPLQ